MATPQHDVRPSPIAGEWYPGNAARLAATIDEFIANADVSPPDGQLVGILAPHAGHRYSGQVAGYAFKPVQGLDVDIVALVGPSHYLYPGPILTTGHAAYETPLGVVPVDHAALNALREQIDIEPVYHDREHSLEIELPFLQRTLGKFSLVPLVLLDHSVATTEKLGHALARVLAGRKALLVASSDLSHRYPEAVANKLDQTVLDAVAAYDPAGIIQAEEQGKGYACGRGAIASVMTAARDLGANTAQVVHYATSGVVTHDYENVVGYGAAWFFHAS
jgi:AmmeMemoRadiSam system protein B